MRDDDRAARAVIEDALTFAGCVAAGEAFLLAVRLVLWLACKIGGWC